MSRGLTWPEVARQARVAVPSLGGNGEPDISRTPPASQGQKAVTRAGRGSQGTEYFGGHSIMVEGDD